MNINVLETYKNYVVIKDNNNNNIYLYSYNELLCYYDKKRDIIIVEKNEPTITNKKHITIFKKYIDK